METQQYTYIIIHAAICFVQQDFGNTFRQTCPRILQHMAQGNVEGLQRLNSSLLEKAHGQAQLIAYYEQEIEVIRAARDVRKEDILRFMHEGINSDQEELATTKALLVAANARAELLEAELKKCQKASKLSAKSGRKQSQQLSPAVCVVEVGVQTDSAPSTSHASPKAHPPLHRCSWADMVEQDSDSSEPMN